MARHESEIVIKAKDQTGATFSKLKGDIKDTDQVAKTSTSKIGSVFKSGMAQVALATGGAIVALAAFKSAIIGSIEAAAEHEQITLKLSTGIELAGGTWEKERDKVVAFTDAIQEQTQFSNTEMLESMRSIVTISGKVEESYDAARLAADIASTGMFDLASASRNVALALTGEVAMLGRYIPELKMSSEAMKGVKTQSGKAEVAMRVLNEKFSGAAAKNVTSYKGASAQLTNAFADLNREVGEILIPILANLAKSLTPVISKFAAFIDKLRDVPETLLITGEDFEESFANYFTKPIGDAGNIVLPKATLESNLLAQSMQWAGNIAKNDLALGLSSAVASATDATATINNVNVVVAESGDAANLAAAELDKLRDSYIDLSEVTGEMRDSIDLSIDKFEELRDGQAEVAEMVPGMQQVWTAAFNDMSQRMAWLTAGINAGMMSILDTQMTGSQRLTVIWKAMAATILGQIAQIISKKLIWWATEQSLNAATVAMLAGQQVAVMSLTAAYFALAAAKKAALGPMGFFFNRGGLVPGFDFGGQVSGPGGVDNVPAFLTAGEFVVNREASDRYLPLLLAINESHGQAIQRLQGGGSIYNNDNRNISRRYNINIGEGSRIGIDEVIDLLIPKLEEASLERRFELE